MHASRSVRARTVPPFWKIWTTDTWQSSVVGELPTVTTADTAPNVEGTAMTRKGRGCK